MANGDTVPCSECGEDMPLRRLTEARYTYCIGCSEGKPGEMYFLNTSGFKNNGAEIVRADQHYEFQQHNQVRG